MGLKQEILKLLEENREQYLSGQEIANRLSFSRTAVWKSIKALKEDGYEIDAISNKGYRLDTTCDLLSAENLSPTYYQDDLLPLYKLYSIESLLSEIKSRKVWLKSGAYLVIDYTEALTVIDVNTGKFDKGKNKAQTLLKINLEAAIEAMRQIRLRNISGIIIIDFIDMTDNEHKEQLLNQLKAEAMKDPIKTSIMGMTRLNLLEMTRMKIREQVTIK